MMPRMPMMDQWQAEIFAWVRATFGEDACTPHERARRFLEEALELAQAAGLTKEDVDALAGYVFARPAGEAEQEIGGVGLTLLAYAESVSLSAELSKRKEWMRVLAKTPEHFRARHNEKADAGVAVRAVEPKR